MARGVSPFGYGCLPLFLLIIVGAWFLPLEPEPPPTLAERQAFSKRALSKCREELIASFHLLGWVDDKGGNQADETKVFLATFNIEKQIATVDFGIVYEGTEMVYSCDYRDDFGVAIVMRE